MARWIALSPRGRGVVVAAGVVVGAIVLMASLNAYGRAPGGPALSSHATGADGLAAWEELLDRNDHPTSEVRRDLDAVTLRADTTLVAIGQVFTPPETEALRRFLQTGGRLIVGDIEAAEVLHAFGDPRAEWHPDGRPRTVGTVAGRRAEVRGDGIGSWSGSEGKPLLRAGETITAVSHEIGNGVLIALADPTPLTNEWLAERDNAWFAVNVAGAATRPVVFAEHGHGYGDGSGYGALPEGFKAAFWFGLVAAVVGALAFGKRLGPADPVLDAAPPERVRYVQAVASTLARTGDPAAAAEPLRARARERIARRAAQHDLADAADLAAAAQTAGLAPEDAAALTRPIADDADLMALARAVTHLEEH